jgi:hypothetical protein
MMVEEDGFLNKLRTLEAQLESEKSQPHLGCATTLELAQELAARVVVADITGETWPRYRTVGGDQGGFPD